MIYAITDIETTGGSLKTTKITEIAIFLHDGEKIIDEFSSLVNPRCKIPSFISRLTGISNDMVADAPEFYEIAKKIVEFTEDTVFVAHNVGFDYNVIRKEYRSLGYDYRREHLCTVRASRYLLPNHDSYSLGKLTDDLGIEIKGRHRAGGDALATAKLFTLLNSSNEEGVKGFIQKDINPKSLHPSLDLATIEELPAKTGIYIFKNTDDEIIYIGKSKNIKTRILQHLKNNRSRKAIQLKEQIAKVTYELTGSELIALLRESELIKKNQPQFNRMLRKSRSNFGLYSFYDGSGYLNLFSDRIKNHEQSPYTTFQKKAEANRFLDKQCQKYKLCKKLLATYPTKGACFNYQIKECNGACVKEESPDDYNERVQLLLNNLTFEEESFFIIEKGREKNEIGLVLIENGSYKGYGFLPTKEGDELSVWHEAVERKTEDKDAYKIIQYYLRMKDHSKVRSFGNY